LRCYATIIGCIYKNNHTDLRRKGGKIRLITGITKENINYRNELMKIVDELCHLDEIKGSIAFSISLSPLRGVNGFIHTPTTF
jgi:hypothetical protein